MFGLDRVGLYAIGALLASGLLFGIYFSWKSNVEQRALLEYNQKQLEQSIKDAESLRKKLSDIEQKQLEIIKQNEEDRRAYETKMKAVDDYLGSIEARKADRPSSDVIKNTIRKLGVK